MLNRFGDEWPGGLEMYDGDDAMIDSREGFDEDSNPENWAEYEMWLDGMLED